LQLGSKEEKKQQMKAMEQKMTDMAAELGTLKAQISTLQTQRWQRLIQKMGNSSQLLRNFNLFLFTQKQNQIQENCQRQK